MLYNNRMNFNSISSKVPSWEDLYDYLDKAKPLLATSVALGALGMMVLGYKTSRWPLIAAGAGVELGLAAKWLHGTFSLKNPFPNGERVSAWDEEKKAALQRYANANMTRAYWAMTIGHGAATRMLYSSLDNPQKELVLIETFLGSLQTALLPFLSECACCNSENFNRFVNTRRADFEEELIKNAIHYSPPLQDTEFRYLSIGSGELLQDFINVGKLIRAGYKKLDVTLVDPDFHENYDTEFYRMNPNSAESHKENLMMLKAQFSFLDYVAKEQGVDLKVSYFDSIHKVNGTFQAISVIDFDDFHKAFEDLMAATGHIAQDGRMYIGYGLYDLVFSATGLDRSHIHSENEESKILIGQMTTWLETELQSKNQKELQLAFLSTELHLEQWIYFIPSLLKLPKETKISLTLIQPQKKNYFGQSTGEPNTQYNQQSLERIFSLLCQRDVKVTLVPSLDEFKKSDQKYDVILDLFRIGKKLEIDKDYEWLKAHQPDASQLTAIQIEGQVVTWGKSPVSGTTIFSKENQELIPL